MSKARLVITAVTVENRPVSEVARAYGVARSWVYTLLARYQAEGEAAFEPRSRRPKTSPSAIGDATVGLIIELRKGLAGQGLDAGPDTLAWHLAPAPPGGGVGGDHRQVSGRHGLVVPEPRKRPKSSYLRFQAEQPNECWQADFTHYPLAGGTGTEILTWLDDHSRFALRVTAWHRVTGADRARAVPRRRRGLWRPGIYLDRYSTGWCSPLGSRAAATPSSTNCAAWASPRRTANRTTRKPRARPNDSSAPRSALSYPRFSREELGGRFLGLMAYPRPKG
jgi:hypothetical protein